MIELTVSEGSEIPMTATTVAALAALVLLAGCDSRSEELWYGALFANGWDELPDTFNQPPSSGWFSSQANCERGMTALHNQWRNTLTNHILAAQTKGDNTNPFVQALAKNKTAYENLRDSMFAKCELRTFRESANVLNAGPGELIGLMLGGDDQRTRASNHLLYLCEGRNSIEACKALLDAR